MSPLVDAHAHFFAPGYVDRLPESCRRRDPDEITLYAALAQQHEIAGVLAVGYEGERWAAGNNGYLGSLLAARPWVRPLAYVGRPAEITVAQLESWQVAGFVGISLYLMDAAAAAALAVVAPAVWHWLSARRWLVSVNSRGALWAAWTAVLDVAPGLRLLIAHLGQPRAVAAAPEPSAAAAALAEVTALAAYPNVHVKLSGFYALSVPGYAYPHRAAWPYVAALADAFGSERLLWASDFSPALEVVSFAQTVAVIAESGLFDAAALTSVYGDNLARLLAAVNIEETNIER
jgi:predicted TIM-barrel fold metal-dependent hydrolase